MNNKYIIDGVEYAHGEEVEVSDDGKLWVKSKIVGLRSNMNYPIEAENDAMYSHIRKIQPTLSQEKKEIKKIDTYKIRGAYQEIQYTEQGSNVSGGDDTIDSIRYVADVVNEVIDVLNTDNLSGRKATLILDGTEHTVTFE